MPNGSNLGSFAYQGLAHDLRAKLRSGDFNGGGRLPTEIELAEDYNVSRQTVRRAMQELVAEGLVYRVRGRGTFPAEGERQLVRQFGSVKDLLSLSDDTIIEVIDPLHRSVDIDAAGRLGHDTDVVHILTYRRLYRDLPIGFTKAYLPPHIAEQLSGLPELQSAGETPPSSTVIGLIEEHAGIKIMTADQTITVGALPDEVAGVIHYEPGSPMLRIDRLYRDADASPVQLATSWWDPNLYTYRLHLKRQ